MGRVGKRGGRITKPRSGGRGPKMWLFVVLPGATNGRGFVTFGAGEYGLAIQTILFYCRGQYEQLESGLSAG